MEMDHSTLVILAKSFGLFYLMAMAAIALAYALWPSKQAEFDRAARDILDDGEAPWW